MSQENPQPKKSRQPFSDIVSVKKSAHSSQPVADKESIPPEVDNILEVKEEKTNEKSWWKEARAVKKSSEPAAHPVEDSTVEDNPSGIPRWPFFSILAIAVFSGLIYLGFVVLPRLEINISLKKYPVAFNESVDASKNFSSYSSSTPIKLQAELLSESRNLQLSFPATGKQQVANKSQGTITIYNSYSSDSQVLVASTRFSTPDNKIFRLVKAVKVPGAQIQEGKIIASSIDAAVVADQPGADYNIGSGIKLSVPGFKDTPKYAGFSAAFSQPTTGGFVGEIAVPTDKDLSDADAQIKQALQDNLRLIVLPQIPKEFKIIDGSSDFKISNEKINKVVDKDNKFSIFAEATMKIMVFKESDLESVLVAKSLSGLSDGDYELNSFNIDYQVSRSDFSKGEIFFSAKGQITFEKKINSDLFRQQAAGKDEVALKTLVFSLPGLEKAQISFWPIYIKKAPSNIDKIKINIQ